MSYNGWSNYETWCAKLWIDTDEFTYLSATEMAEEVAKDGPQAICGTQVFREPQFILAARLKEWFEEMQPEMAASVWLDLLNAAISEIDWNEIAESYLSEYAEAD
jgi:hypothetical protein